MPPTKDAMACLFQDARDEQRKVDPAATASEKARVEKRNKLLEETKRVKDVKGFSAFTPESEQAFVAELRFMRTLHEANLWHRAGDAWVTGLLPKGGLIHLKKEGAHVFVLKAYDVAALC